MRLNNLVVVLIVLAVAFSGCDPVGRTTLEDNNWTLVSFQDAAGTVTDVPHQMASTLYFNKRNRSVAGTVRCNNLSSTYWTSWRRISFGDIAVTEMGCGPDKEGQDRFVIDVLSNLATYSINGDTLQLRSKTGNMLTYMLDEAIKPEDQVLQIEIGSSFGECLGYCSKTMTVDPETITLTQIGRPAQDYPEITKKIATPPNTWNELIALLDLSTFNALPEVIGCPDCADGGAERIKITTADSTKLVTIEFNAQIKGLEPFLKALRELKQEVFTQMD